MSDIKLFSLVDQHVIELVGSAATLEKHLQQQIEKNMDVFLGVRFLATEKSTGHNHRGRIDSLGIDENNCPVIIEYKRHSNENVINQGLFYLNWLLDHKAEFQWLVMEKLGKDIAENIEWSEARLLCIASDFTHYDEHAIQQINRNIELIRYRYFGQDLLLLELINAQSAKPNSSKDKPLVTDVSINNVSANVAKRVSTDKTQSERLAEASPELVLLFDELCSFVEQLGDEVQRKDLKLYTAFKKIKNFVSIVVMPQRDARLQIYLKLPGEKAEENSFSRDVTNIGHWGTGNLEVSVRNLADLEKAKALIMESYEAS
jgi:predicted transport protein